MFQSYFSFNTETCKSSVENQERFANTEVRELHLSVPSPTGTSLHLTVSFQFYRIFFSLWGGVPGKEVAVSYIAPEKKSEYVMKNSFGGMICWKLCAYKEDINSTGNLFVLCASKNWMTEKKNPYSITTRIPWTLKMTLTYPAVFAWQNVIYSFQSFRWGSFSSLEHTEREAQEGRKQLPVAPQWSCHLTRHLAFLFDLRTRWTLCSGLIPLIWAVYQRWILCPALIKPWKWDQSF